MADNKTFSQLIRLGPFKGYDPTTADLYQDTYDAGAAANCNPHRYPGALVNIRGRLNIATLLQPAGGTIYSLIPFLNQAQFKFPVEWIFYFATHPTLGVVMGAYNPTNNIEYPLGVGGMWGYQYPNVLNKVLFPFVDGVAFGRALYLSNGMRYHAELPNNIFYWQYPPPPIYTGSSSGPTYANLTQTAGSGNLTAQNYYYAFTRVYQDPHTPGEIFSQETSPSGANVPYPTQFQIAVAATGKVTITFTGSWNIGTYGDGSAWTTNIYRQSDAQPTWLYVGTSFFGALFDDTLSDAQILSNAQLTMHRDQPPCIAVSANGPAGVAPGFNGGFIMAHQDRMVWFGTVPVLVTLKNAQQTVYPQTQVWFSNYETPWEFDAVNQVILVGDEDTGGTSASYYNNPVIYQRTFGQFMDMGDIPAGCLSLGSIGLLLKSKTLWLLLGNSPSSFFVQKVGDYGLFAPDSLAQGAGAAYWFSNEGLCTYDGSWQYIGEKVRSVVNAIPLTDRQNAVGWYSDRTYYISFPAAGITLGYYTVTKEWFPISYSASAAFATAQNQKVPNSINSSALCEVLAARPGNSYIDAWFAGENDLFQPINCYWAGPITDAGSPGSEKRVVAVTLVAPVQQGTATVTVTMDNETVTSPSFDLSCSTPGDTNVRHVWWLPRPGRCFLVQAQVNFSTGTYPEATPVQIYNVSVWGIVGDALVAQT